MSKPVNVYDFDHTIYKGDASLHFILYCFRQSIQPWKRLPSYAVVLLCYLLGLRNRKEVKQVAFSFLRDIQNIDNLVSDFWGKHTKNIKPWYMSQHKTSDVIISASPDFLLEPVAKGLGVKVLLATRMDRYSGKIKGENCRGVEKVRRLQAHNPGIVVNEFYSDSLSDLPLAKLANRAYLVKKRSTSTFPSLKND